MNRRTILATVLASCALFTSFSLTAQAPTRNEALWQAVSDEKQPVLDTLRELVNYESGSGDREGLEKIAAYIQQRLKSLGGETELIEPNPANIYRMHDTPEKLGPMVKATFRGTGARSVLLIAHMDTVYLKGMLAKQPFRIDGDRAYGLGISDDKSGVAAIIHAISALKRTGFNQFGHITVLINGDEEISSPGSRTLLTSLGSEHDAVLSCESTSVANDRLSLATSGIAAVSLKVKGRASHAGSAPHLGVNALYELSHQIMQMRDLSRPQEGLKLNWTVSSAGTNRNVIPADAIAHADVRVWSISDYDGIEAAVRERAKKQLLPDAGVEVVFERRRPPLEPSDAAKKLGARATEIYREIGRALTVSSIAEGGGTDAAFASLKAKGPVIERFGFAGFGAHSSDNEYIAISSIEPRLYLLARMVMEVTQPQ
jgi:glutamate carboxypeptidase